MQAFNIHLDGRAVKTPAKTKLAIPSEPLSYMIALEWCVLRCRDCDCAVT